MVQTKQKKRKMDMTEFDMYKNMSTIFSFHAFVNIQIVTLVNIFHKINAIPFFFYYTKQIMKYK